MANQTHPWSDRLLAEHHQRSRTISRTCCVNSVEKSLRLLEGQTLLLRGVGVGLGFRRWGGVSHARPRRVVRIARAIGTQRTQSDALQAGQPPRRPLRLPVAVCCLLRWH